MRMEATIHVGDRDVKFRASASLPRLYRIKFGRDMFVDLQKLKGAYLKNQAEGNEFELDDLELFENLTYMMAKHADPENTKNDIDEWLDDFPLFSIYEVMPQVLELWCLSEQTTVEAKKNLKKQVGS